MPTLAWRAALYLQRRPGCTGSQHKRDADGALRAHPSAPSCSCVGRLLCVRTVSQCASTVAPTGAHFLAWRAWAVGYESLKGLRHPSPGWVCLSSTIPQPPSSIPTQIDRALNFLVCVSHAYCLPVEATQRHCFASLLSGEVLSEPHSSYHPAQQCRRSFPPATACLVARDNAKKIRS